MNFKMFKSVIRKIESICVFDLTEDKITFTQADIDQIENKIGFILPADYSYYLLNYGNNYIKDEYRLEYFTGDVKKHVIVDCLFGLHNDSLDIYKEMDFDREIPSECYVPIAGISGGDLVCLTKNNVFIWKHDALDNIIPIAKTFLDFINGFELYSSASLDVSHITLNFSPDLDAVLKEAAERMNKK